MHTLTEKFFSDPEWVKVEEMVMKHIDALLDMSTIDTKQPAEHVKAEIIGRTLAHQSLLNFLNDTRFVNRQIPPKTNPFK